MATVRQDLHPVADFVPHFVPRFVPHFVPHFVSHLILPATVRQDSALSQVSLHPPLPGKDAWNKIPTRQDRVPDHLPFVLFALFCNLSSLLAAARRKLAFSFKWLAARAEFQEALLPRLSALFALFAVPPHFSFSTAHSRLRLLF